MLHRLEIQNFQCHRRFALEFDPAITTLCGKSDVGKSAVLRSLRWLCRNRPRGDTFIRHKRKTAHVKLIVDGHTLTRTIGQKGNLYSFDDRQYKAFGSDVPTDVASLLNLSDENFQLQHEPSFWVSKSAGEVGKELNAIVNLSLIDRTLAKLATEARRARMTSELCRGRLRGAEERRDELSWVREADRELKELEELHSAISDKRELLGALLHLCDGLRDSERRHVARLERLRLGESLLSLGEKIQRLADRATALAAILQEIKQGEGRAKCLRKEIARQSARMRARLKGRCPACGRRGFDSSRAATGTSVTDRP